MHGSNSFMTMTINRCIDYTKASKGVKLVPKLETVELKPKFDMPVDLMRTVQSVVEIVVDTPVAGICSHIITDKQWLLENLLCLLSNAVKYSHKGTVEVGMDLEGAPSEPQFLRFEVQDSGVGLSEEAMQTLFNPFKQAQRLAGGTGLGLFSLAKRVEALHGQYGVRLRPDGAQGSVFWFTIPYRPDLQSAKMAEAQSALVTLLSSSSDTTAAQEEVQCLSSDASQSLPDCNTPLLTLVVDDAPMIVKMTTMLLSRKGHIVESAVNGADALEKLLQGYERARAVPSGGDNEQRESKRTPYDVVLMDLQMPVLDGIEAIRRLRATERGWQGEQGKLEAQTTAAQAAPSTPRSPHQMVIALSANSDEETRLAALEAGADAFMAKPFTYENFQICLRTAESARQPM
jgi:CheY-like chemotaxis protein